jgi:hypothetical protein
MGSPPSGTTERSRPGALVPFPARVRGPSAEPVAKAKRWWLKRYTLAELRSGPPLWGGDAFQLKVREYRAAAQTTTATMHTVTKIEKRLIRGVDRREGPFRSGIGRRRWILEGVGQRVPFTPGSAARGLTFRWPLWIISLDMKDYELIAQQVSSLAEKIDALTRRVNEVEQVNARLESAALTTARALQEIAIHWDAVYEAMRREESRPGA